MRRDGVSKVEFGRARRRLPQRLVVARGPVRGDSGSRVELISLVWIQSVSEGRAMSC